MIVALAVVGLLTAMLALYVAAEFSAVTVRRSRIQSHADEGSGPARRLIAVLDHPHQLDDYIATCQVGITLASLVAGAVAQAGIAPVLAGLIAAQGSGDDSLAEEAAAAAVLVVLTALQMVLGELVPKSAALQKPTQVALLTVLPVQWSFGVMRGFIRFLNGSGAAILRLFGVTVAGHHHVHSPAEIEYVIAESARGGVLKPNEELRLSHAVQLSRRPARTLMTPRTAIEGISVDTTLEDAVAVAIDSPYTRMPVYDETIDQIVGVLHARDLVRSTLGDTRGTALSALMREPLFLPETLSADRVLGQLKEQRRTMAILVDEYGGTAGLITIDDILDNLIGDIADEFREGTTRPERLADGRLRLPGAMHVDEAIPWVRSAWQSRYATVGGVVTAALGHVPREGERVTVGGVEVEVERMDGRSVRTVLALPRPGRASDGDHASRGAPGS